MFSSKICALLTSWSFHLLELLFGAEKDQLSDWSGKVPSGALLCGDQLHLTHLAVGTG